MLINHPNATLTLGQSEFLAPAKALIDGIDIFYDHTIKSTEYIHILFDHHEIITADGAETESFHPGDVSISSLDDKERNELFEIFPELATNPNVIGQSARPSAKPKEVMAIMAGA